MVYKIRAKVFHKNVINVVKQGRKRPLDTPKRMIERRRERERKVEGEI